MTVEKFLSKWYDNNFYDGGCGTTKEYSNFQSNYRSVLKDLCNDIGMELHSFNKNHYEFSAVVKSNKTNQFYYISISDVRCWKNKWADDILYRTMEHNKDWTGGSNSHTTLQELAENLLNLDIQIGKNLENKNTRQIANQVEIQNDRSDDLDVNYV